MVLLMKNQLKRESTIHQLELIRIDSDGEFEYPTLIDEGLYHLVIRAENDLCSAISWSQEGLQTRLSIPEVAFFDRVRSYGYAIWQHRWVVLWQADDRYEIAPLM